MRRLAGLLLAILRYLMPAYQALALALAIHGRVSPWAPAQAVLKRYPDDAAVLVGIETRTQRAPDRGVEQVKSRYYLLLPGVLRDARLLRVTQVDRGPISEGGSRAGLVFLLAAGLASLVGTWWLWWRLPPPRGDAVSRT